MADRSYFAEQNLWCIAGRITLQNRWIEMKSKEELIMGIFINCTRQSDNFIGVVDFSWADAWATLQNRAEQSSRVKYFFCIAGLNTVENRVEQTEQNGEEQSEQRAADFSSTEQSRIEQCWAEQGHLLHWYAKHHTASHLQHRLPPVQDLGTYCANFYLVNKGPQLQVRGPSGLLTFSFAPFGRSDPRIDTSGSPVLPKIQWKIQKLIT